MGGVFRGFGGFMGEPFDKRKGIEQSYAASHERIRRMLCFTGILC